MNPIKVFAAARAQRPGAVVRKIWAGDNWPHAGAIVTFDAQPVVHIVHRNDLGCDSAIEWEDGYLTIMRDSDEQSFSDSPVRPGKARTGVGKKTSGNTRKDRKRKGAR